MEKRPLSPDQEKAVMSNNRHIRILAGAGAGKTETLTGRILYLLLCQHVEPERLLLLLY